MVCFPKIYIRFIERSTSTEKVLPAELIKAKIKFHYNIVQPENFENFYGCLSVHQNARKKKHFKIGQIVKTNFGLNSILRQCEQKRN